MSKANGHAKAAPPPPIPDGLSRLVANALLSRQEWLRGMMDTRRDIDDECGYEKNPSAATYQSLYDREAIAARVVEVLPRESWQVQPAVYESEDEDVITPFEAAWDDLGKQLRGERSHYQDEAGSPVWEYLRRADELSGIGSFGVLYLGLDDGLLPSQPVAGYEESHSAPVAPGEEVPTPTGNYRLAVNAALTRGRRLLFLRAFPESLVQITRYEANPTSPRFGQPVNYSITLNDPNDSHGGIGLSLATIDVHWTRAIHLADNLGSSEVFGVPRMRPVLNRLTDLRKIYGAAGEAFWRNAILKLFFETHPQLGGDVEIDREGLKDHVENMMNGLQQWMATSGMSVKSIGPSVVDPGGQVSVHIDAICIKLGIPKRIFMGSERGELASSQDDAAWNDRLKARQAGYVTPRIIVPFVDRLIGVGVLPVPEGFGVEWPDLTSQTDQEKATVAATRTGALAQYVGGGVEALVPPLDYLTRVIGFTTEEALSILENAAAAQEDAVDPASGAALPAAPPEVEEEEDADAPPVAPLVPPVLAAAARNAFCPTGAGGGQDNSCGRGEGGGKGAGGGGKVFGSHKEVEEHFDDNFNVAVKKGNGVNDAEYLAAATLVEGEQARLNDEFKAVRELTEKGRTGFTGRMQLVIGHDFWAEGKETTNGVFTSGGTTNRMELSARPMAWEPDAAPLIGDMHVGSDFQTLFRHELGHEVFFNPHFARHKKSWDKKMAKHVGTSTVSKYGGTNTSELFAESFAAYTHPGYKRGSLPPDIEEFLDKNVRGKK